MQRKTGISRAPRARMSAAPAVKATNGPMTHMANAATWPAARPVADDGLAAWLARYEPVEREIIEAHERRIANRMRNYARRREVAPRAEAARTPHAGNVRAEPPRDGGKGKRDYGTYEISVVEADDAEARCRVGRRAESNLGIYGTSSAPNSETYT